jgi:ABC-2 type transport system permease protein
MREHLTQVGVLARRSMLKTLRQPFQLFPIVFFPLILLAVNASGLKSATHLPGFPTHSYISFAIAVAFIQGGMFSLINTGTNLAEDIESGFFNRLALTPLRRMSLARPCRASSRCSSCSSSCPPATCRATF